jgi:hypothetical protein
MTASTPKKYSTVISSPLLGIRLGLRFNDAVLSEIDYLPVPHEGVMDG